MNLNLPQFGSHFRSKLSATGWSERWKHEQTRGTISVAALVLTESLAESLESTPLLKTMAHPKSGKRLDIVSVQDRFFGIATDKGFDALCLDSADALVRQELSKTPQQRQTRKSKFRPVVSTLTKAPHGAIPNRDVFRQKKKELLAKLIQ